MPPACQTSPTTAPWWSARLSRWRPPGRGPPRGARIVAPPTGNPRCARSAAERRSWWHVLAWITPATSIALLALLVIFAIQVDHELSSPPARDNEGLARLGVIVTVGAPAMCLTAVAFVALVSILSRQRSVMIAATALEALVTIPMEILASWMLYRQVTMPDF